MAGRSVRGAIGAEALEWVKHGNAAPIFSLDIQPTGERLATGAQDPCVNIWSLSPPPSFSRQQPNSESTSHSNCISESTTPKNTPGLLASVQAHNGTVNVVRWSPDGQLLASGSVDHSVCILQQRPGNNLRDSRDASSTINESWKCALCLRGHDCDVVDLSWCPGGSDKKGLLASASLDNKVFIWDVVAGCAHRMLCGHTSFVKGVVWDPLGEFVASQSDDKSVIVWNAQGTWEQAARVHVPGGRDVVNNALSLRGSWSPDGRKLIVVNVNKADCMNCAIVCDRGHWGFKLRGLEREKGCITVAKFSPRRYNLGGEAVQYWAAGSTKGTVSLWREACVDDKQIGKNRISGVVGLCSISRAVTDIAWMPDGGRFLAASTNGTVAMVQVKDNVLDRVVGKQGEEGELKDRSESITRQSKATASTSCINNNNNNNTSSINSPVTGQKKSRKRLAPVCVEPGVSNMAEPPLTRRKIAQEASGNLPVNCSVAMDQSASTRPQFSQNPRTCVKGFVLPSPCIRDEFQIHGVQIGNAVSGNVHVKNLSMENGPRAKVAFRNNGGKVLWKADVHGSVVFGVASQIYVAMATWSGIVKVFATTGEVIMCFKLESTPCKLQFFSDNKLMVILATGRIRIWDVDFRRSILDVNIVPALINEESHAQVDSVDFGESGLPVVCLTNGEMFIYDTESQVWTFLGTNDHRGCTVREIVLHKPAQDGGVADASATTGPCSSLETSIPEKNIPEQKYSVNSHAHSLEDLSLFAFAALAARNVDKYKAYVLEYLTKLCSMPDSEGEAFVEESVLNVFGDMSTLKGILNEEFKEFISTDVMGLLDRQRNVKGLKTKLENFWKELNNETDRDDRD